MNNRLLVVSFAVLAIQPAVSRLASAQTTEANRKVVARVIPQYPSVARSMRIEGNVRIDVLVEANGKVKSLEAKGGHPVLVQSAEDALRQWKWEPAAHETHELIELRFTP